MSDNLLSTITQWLETNQQLTYSLIGLSILTFIVSLIMIPWLIIRLPENYFVDTSRHTSQLRNQHPVVGFGLKVLKNILGIALILAGIAMLLLPGQGILCLLIGISLTDFPGKYRLERWLIDRPSVFKAINWIREKADRPPLLHPATKQEV